MSSREVLNAERGLHLPHAVRHEPTVALVRRRLRTEQRDNLCMAAVNQLLHRPRGISACQHTFEVTHVGWPILVGAVSVEQLVRRGQLRARLIGDARGALQQERKVPLPSVA